MIAAIACVLFAHCAAPAPSVPPVDNFTEAVLDHAVPRIAQREGLPCDGDVCAAYLDTIASPPVWTICHGETQGVRAGDVWSRQRCMDSLRPRVARYWSDVQRGFTFDPLTTYLSPARGSSITSLAYNIGVGAYLRSTALRRLNAGDVMGACVAATWYNRAGGRVWRGLVNRRDGEYADCTAGL